MNDQRKSLPFDGLYWIVEDAIYFEQYKVKIWFRDGSVKVVDLENELSGEMFESLKNVEEFSKLRYDPEASTIVWPNGTDIAPEFLYEIGEDVIQHDDQIRRGA
jgi:Protein of unknown function (DUF2442)